VLGELLKATNWKPHSSGIDLFVGIKEGASAPSEYGPALAQFIQKCRENGLSVDYALRPGSWKRQQELAENARARFFCVIGEAFVSGKAQLRRLDGNTPLGDKTFEKTFDEIFESLLKFRSGIETSSDAF
jgi:histidyl-tRNA synthetase